jgi:DNA-directed RNA polymerase specialized sigma24 family protein
MPRRDASLLFCLRPVPDRPEPWTDLTRVVRANVARTLGPCDPDLLDNTTSLAVYNIYRRRGTFRGADERSARAWIRQVTRNAIRRSLRRERPQGIRWVSLDAETFPHIDPRDSGDAAPLARRDVLMRLQRLFRGREQLLECWMLQEDPARRLTDHEIAVCLGLKASTVRKYRSRARRLISREFTR